MINAYFDCGFGASGDMLLGALLGCGVSLEYLNKELAKLSVHKDTGKRQELFSSAYEVRLEEVKRATILAKKATVLIAGNSVNGDTTHLASHGKKFTQIRSYIESSCLDKPTKDLSISIFERLAHAESRVHGKDIESVHFHEVGCLDAVIDIVGFAIAYNFLKIEKSFVSSLPLGSGMVKTEHGLFPVPSPAVAYLLEAASTPTNSLALDFECLTPTGAAILCTINAGWQFKPAFKKIEAVGYGAGTLDPKEHPNLARVMVGECESKPALNDDEKNEASSQLVALIEANIDDMAPDILSFTQEKLFNEGALDVSITATTMKKGRSGHLVTVIAKPSDRKRLQELLFRETSTIGVRSHFVEREVLKRGFVEVGIGDSTVNVKVAYDSSGAIVNISPEYSDCVSYAREKELPLKEVYDIVLASYRKSSS